MRVKDRIHPRDVLPNRLRIKVGRGVNQYNFSRKFQHDRRARAPVVGIAGVAYRAIAAQRGHAHRGATAQHRERGLHTFTFLRQLSGTGMLVRSTSRGSRGCSGLWRTRQRIGDFYIRHAYFVEAVLQKIFFRGSQIALRLFPQQRQRVDSLARSDDVQPRLLPLLMHQSQLQHRGHIKRCQKALERHLEFLGIASAEFDPRVQCVR